MKATVKDLQVEHQRVLVRVDFNVPMENGLIMDDSRIRASLPTIQYLIQQKARVILLSHLDRPNGFVVEEQRMNPVADRLANLLHQPVGKVNNCIGPEVHEAVKGLEPGQVILLENVRFHPGEVVNDAHFASRLASAADVYVDDAFASAHRNHASTVGITRYLPAVAGLLMESELLNLQRVKNAIRQPFISVLGGARLVDKVHYIDDNLQLGNRILLGGILANTFLRAKELETGQSNVEGAVIGLARSILADYSNLLELPSDVVVADALSDRAKKRVVSVNRVQETDCIVDIGPATVEKYSQILNKANTIIWNGPLGAVEFLAFRKGTVAIARSIAAVEGALKVAGGGDTLAVLGQENLSEKMDAISTGGASFLDALGNKQLPGVAALLNKADVAKINSISERNRLSE